MIKQSSRSILCILPFILSLAVQANESESSSTPGYEIELSGLVNLESAYLTGDYNEQENELKYQLRKAKIEAQLKLDFGLTSNFELALDDDFQLSASGASLSYQLLDEYTFTGGLYKNAIGLQNSTGSKKLRTMERSLLSNALIEDTGLGMSVDFDIQDTYFFANVFQTTQGHEAQTLGYSARVAHDIKLLDFKLQVGGNYEKRNFDDYLYQLEQKPELHLSDKVITSSVVFLQSTQLISADVAMIKDKLTLQAEVMSKSLDVNTFLFGLNTYEYDGFYLQGSFLLTDKKRKFKNGSFAKDRLSDSSAFEIVSRYSLINLKEINTQTHSNFLVGLNYYVNPNIKVMSQVSIYNHDEESSMAVALRTSASF